MTATSATGPRGARRGSGLAGPGGLRLFRVSGVPVMLAPSWWIGSVAVIALYAPLIGHLVPDAGIGMSLTFAAVFAILLGLSVLAHELGHTMVALRLGIPVRRVRLFLLGGLSEVARTPRAPVQEALVAAAGPAVSVVLAIGFALPLFAIEQGAMWVLVAQCAVANLVVAVFNLLPGLPLDGGRLLRAGVWAVTGARATGTTAAVIGGWSVATGLFIWALIGIANDSPDQWLRLAVCLVTGWFVIAGANAEREAEQRRSWPPGLRLRDVMLPVLQLPAESPVSAALEASAGRGVVLVRADGVAAGLLDTAAAERLALEAPSAPAGQAAEPVQPDSVLLLSEPGEDIAERVRETPVWQFLVVDDEGRPAGVLRREDLREAFRAQRG